MSYSNPGVIGFYSTKTGLSITHGATHREYPHFLSCFNEPSTPWVNVVYKIAESGKNIAWNFCDVKVLHISLLSIIML